MSKPGSASTPIAVDLFTAVNLVLRADTSSLILKLEPHFLQNLEARAFVKAHDGHTRSRLTPHLAQKTASARLSLWHFAQSIVVSCSARRAGLWRF
jgi:hypothetical protein